MEELIGQRFCYCPGLVDPGGSGAVDLVDLQLILLEKYNGRVVLRSRACTRLLSKEQDRVIHFFVVPRRAFIVLIVLYLRVTAGIEPAT
jgi:hypothetical protein